MSNNCRDPKSRKARQTAGRRAGVAESVPASISGNRKILKANLEDTAASTLLWSLKVFFLVIKMLTFPIALVLASYILRAMIAYTSSSVICSIAQGLSPLCSVPLLSMIPVCSYTSQAGAKQDPPFTKLIEAQKGLLPVMDAAGSGTNLALDFKRVEMRISDLNTLVQQSDLENKDKLSNELYEFEASAAKASLHLSRMESNVEGVVNAILVTNDYVIQALEAIEHQEQRGSIKSALLSPFVARAASRNNLIQTFNYMAGIMETELLELIESTMTTKATLGQLHANMKTIHFRVSKEKGQTENDQEKTLADLWTLVGGNRAKLARFKGHHSLLSQIGNYHETATTKVSQALVELQKLEEDLRRLKARVATEVLPDEPIIPLQLHIENLRKGVEVLTQGKLMAKMREDQVIEQMADRRQYIRLEST